MNKTKVFKGLKVVFILLLLIMISFLILMQWRSDIIVRKAVIMIQDQLQDSLQYDHISLEWIRYFPSAALRMDGLRLGPSDDPLLQGGTIDIVLRLFPLLNEKIIINKLMISDSRVNIIKYKGRWSYELFKKREASSKIDKADVDGKNQSAKWETLVKQLHFKNTIIFYNDNDGLQFSLDVKEGEIAGNLTKELFDAKLNMHATVDNLRMHDYELNTPFPFEMSGKYKYDVPSGTQELKNWQIQNEGIELEVQGHIRKEEDHQWMDIQATWFDSDPQFMKAWMPVKTISNWNDYMFSGKSGGKLTVKGNSSKQESPHITISSELEDGSIKFPGQGGHLKNITLDIAYDNGESKSKNNSYFRANLRNGSFQGNKLKADMRIDNLEQPVMNIDMTGALPAGLLNLFMDSTLMDFKEGVFDIDHYRMQGLNYKTFSTKTFIEKSETKLKADHLRLNYQGDEIEITEGDVTLDATGKMALEIDEFIWNKATGEDITGDLTFAGDKVDFDLKGLHSKGEVQAKGTITGLGNKPVMNGDWKVRGIEMKELLASFENFDQTFLTSENLNGKADIWCHATIPYDADGNIMPRDISVKAAIEIKDGELKDLKTLEDFSKYIHMDDLREIRFNEFRNYMKIENGKVYLPVMFIQSSAVNLSINGVHSFDQEILYNLKINAGQVAANKLKKFDPLKKLKVARKSGWINMYFILSGTVDEVRYEQDQKQVISAFEQSSGLKESLRSYLVDRFGHDVYWLEPNEWEDIPEYK